MPLTRESAVQTEHETLTIPLLLAVLAPAAVIVSIEYLKSVWWTFAIYQLGICLVAPVIESRLKGRTWREHAVLVGLSGTTRRTLAGILGVSTACVTGAFLVLTRDRFLDPGRLESTLEMWGVSTQETIAMLMVMAVLNGAAEELFWRGYFPGRVTRAQARAPVALTIVLPAILYASYHAVTISHLVADVRGVSVMTAGVLGAGLFWGWLRRRTGSVWPPLLSHAGAVIAYLAVHVWLTGRR
jgi:membrane protease YdiL (CAAX protease family)